MYVVAHVVELDAEGCAKLYLPDGGVGAQREVGELKWIHVLKMIEGREKSCPGIRIPIIAILKSPIPKQCRPRYYSAHKYSI